jgi:hypothetical protein
MASSDLIAAFVEQGPRCSYHLLRERDALRRKRRADMEPHLAARLNLLAAREGTGLHEVLKVAGCRDIRGLTHEVVDAHRAEVIEQARLLPADSALDLYRYFRFFGDFRVANLLRTQALHACLRSQERTSHVMPDALAAALEAGRPDLVLELARTRVTREQDRNRVDETVAMAHALQGEIPEAARLWGRMFQASDGSFRDLIQGRTVAVVGPAPPSEDLRAEIDAFDFVVRTNYQGKLDPRAGSRTDISYYNGNRLISHRDEIIAIAPSLRWLVSARGSDQALRRMLPTHPGIRSAESAPAIFFHANPLAIPAILIDLVRFVPARIKLFGSDFFSSKTSHTQGYHRRPIEAEALSHSLRIHDPFSSFRLVQQLVRTGLCTVDALAEGVLRLDGEQYAARLQELYGGHIVANEMPQKKPPGTEKTRG